MTPTASTVSAQRPERGPELLDKDLLLLPGRKVPAFVEPVVMNQFGMNFAQRRPLACHSIVIDPLQANGPVCLVKSSFR
jgi:hypothetical protein